MSANAAGHPAGRDIDSWQSRGFWGEAFAWRDSASPRVFPRVILFGAISALVCITSGGRPYLELPVGPHEVAGAVLGLLLVLRTNAGYDRWWEARKLWGGIVNQSRNIAIQAISYGSDDTRWREDVVRWTIAFAHASRRSLRGERALPEIEALLGKERADRVSRSAHMPTAVARAVGGLLREAHDAGRMNGFAFAQAERERAMLIDHIGACERILKTPLPTVYSIKIRRFLVLFLVTLTFALLHKFQSDWLVPPFLMLVAYPVLAVDEIGAELQNPFATRNLGHLPLDDICTTIEGNLLGLLEEAGEMGEGSAEPEPGMGDDRGVAHPGGHERGWDQ